MGMMLLLLADLAGESTLKCQKAREGGEGTSAPNVSKQAEAQTSPQHLCLYNCGCHQSHHNVCMLMVDRVAKASLGHQNKC